MNLRSCCLSLLALLPAVAAMAQGLLPPPAYGPAPLLFVRVSGPAGLRLTFYQGRPQGRAFDAPAVVGLRPGYLHRFEVSHIPGRPGISFYPTLEVRGTACLSPKVAASAFPAPVVITEADIEAVLGGAMVTKVVYLEDPDRAVPVPTRPDSPLEIDLHPRTDPVAEARERGRPLLIVRMGGRLLMTKEELACESTGGTELLPGEKVLGHPTRPPCLPWEWLHRPDECVHDGGDRGERVGLDPAGNLHGLDPEDTVAEFTDSHGRRGVTCSNRICLCVPRFAVLRVELPVDISETVLGPNAAKAVCNREVLAFRQPSLLALQAEQLRATVQRARPMVKVGIEGAVPLERVEVLEAQALVLGPVERLCTKAVLTLTEVERARLVKQIEFARELSANVALREVVGTEATAAVGRVEAGPQLVGSIVATREIAVCCPEAIPCPPDKPLVLLKCADRTSAQPGEVVTFFLTYSNHGGRPISDVAVTDSLSPRLEYVADSAQSDRPAVFTTQTNEAGSQILRWEITGTLQPGQMGRLRFQARVR
jgi:uncharacterized repeat protein (TIGR01451 family)